eukprot:gene734-8986_t
MTEEIKTDKWLFSKEELELILTREDISLEKDYDHRKSTCAFIQEVGISLKVPQLTIATAWVYFHRFYVLHSFKAYDRHIVGGTCLFLAAKTEETFKKIKDVILACEHVHHKKILEVETQRFENLKEHYFQVEQTLLTTLDFDLKIEHPYKYLVGYVKKIENYKKTEGEAMDPKSRNDLAQVGWNFVNDSLRTRTPLMFPSQKVGAAAIYLGSKYLEFNLPKNWVDLLDINIEDTKEICIQILNLYDEETEQVVKMKKATFKVSF